MRDMDVSRDAGNERRRILRFAGFQRGGSEARERGWKVLATMKVLNCRKNEARDKVEETMGVLSTPQNYLSLGQHTG